MISNQLDKGTLCLDAVSQVVIENQGYTCYNATGGSLGTGGVNIQVSHGAADFTLSGIQVLVFEGGSSTSIDVTTNIPGVNEESVIEVDYVATGTGPDRVDIAPVVSVGNAEDTCGVSSTLALIAC